MYILELFIILLLTTMNPSWEGGQFLFIFINSFVYSFMLLTFMPPSLKIWLKVAYNMA